jgi:hypothetical protein
MAWFSYIKARQPGPGVMAYGLAAQRLPVDSAVGLGSLHGSFQITERPQFMGAFLVPIDGLGGLQAGQTYMQGLADLDADGVVTTDPDEDMDD